VLPVPTVTQGIPEPDTPRKYLGTIMTKVTNEVAQASFKKDSKLGVNEGPLWPFLFLPIHHYLPPLLYILIGI